MLRGIRTDEASFWDLRAALVSWKITEVQLMNAVWIGAFAAALGLLGVALLTWRGLRPHTSDLGEVSGRWLSEYRATQTNDPAR